MKIDRITALEERNFFKVVARNYSRDETVLSMSRKLKEYEMEIGMQKSEIAELKDKIKDLKDTTHNGKQKAAIYGLSKICRYLFYFIQSNNMTIPTFRNEEDIELINKYNLIDKYFKKNKQ